LTARWIGSSPTILPQLEKLTHFHKPFGIS
jgi:hypothetical protein